MASTNPRTSGARAQGNGDAAHDLGPALNRVAPHNIEAEQALLGAILVNNAAYDRVAFLKPEDFFALPHQKIFETAGKLISGGARVDPLTLKTFFENDEPVNANLTVPQYLGRLAANAATIINARDYGRTIKNLAIRRGLILIGEDMVNTAHDSPVDFPPKEQIEEAEARLYALIEHGSHEREALPLLVSVDKAIADVGAAYKRGGGLAGLSTGISAIDRLIGGLVPGTLNVLAGRPSMGKTALALNIATNNAKQGMPTLVFSLEMSGSELALRQLSRSVNVPASEMQRGRMADPEATMRALLQAREGMKDWPLYIDESGGLTLPQIASKSRRARRKHEVGLIVVDYLQLINGSVYRGHNRTQEVTEITNGLKSLTKELAVPILAVSQLSRNVENREDKRPHLADLRDSGSIEQDADAVMFVYRDAYYLERAKPDPVKADEYEGWQKKLDAAHGKAELIVAKLRNGPTGTADLAFDDKTMTFSTLADDRGRP